MGFKFTGESASSEYIPPALKTFDFTDGSGQVDSDITFTRAGTKLYWDSTGSLATAASGENPVHYDPATLKPLGQVKEAAATNLLTYGSDFSNAAWTKTDITVTSDVSAGPDGTSAYDLITEGSAGTAAISRTVTTTTNTNYVLSILAKYKSTNDYLCVTLWDGTGGTRLWVNLRTKTVGTRSQIGTGSGYSFGGITDCGAWGVRLWLTSRYPGTSTQITIHSASADGSTTRVSGASYSLDLAQLEANTLPTSFIYTTTATAARVADSITCTGLNSKSWFSGTSGVCVLDIMTPPYRAGVNADWTAITFTLDGNNYFKLLRGDQFYSSRWTLQVANSGSTVVDKQTGYNTAGDTGMNEANRLVRVGIAWENNNFRIVLGDSPTIVKSTTGTVPAVTSFTIGSNFVIKKIRFYGAISDADLKLVMKGQEQQFFGKRQALHHGTIIPLSTTNSSSYKEFQDIMQVRAITNGSKLRLLVSNFASGPNMGVVNGPKAFTFKASLKWGGIDTSTIMHAVPFKWNGSTSVVVNPGDKLESDDMDVNLFKYVTSKPAWIQTYKSFAAAPSSYASSYHFFGNGSGANEVSTTTLTDATESGPWISSIAKNTALFPPICLTGEVAVQTPVVAIVGDSISCAGTEYGTLGYDYGWAQLGLTGVKLPWVNCGLQGKPLFYWVRGQDALKEHEPVWEMMGKSGVTHILLALGTNDMAWGGETTATMIESLNAFLTEAHRRGFSVVTCTLPPKTDITNTTELAESAAKRSGYNAYIKTLPSYFDVAAYSEAGSTGLWRTDLGTPTTDGVHPTGVVHNAIRDALISAAPTLFGIVTP